MHITCPKCSFTRDVPDHKLPATAEMATCPKCRHKFRFRTLDAAMDTDFTLEQAPPEQNPPEQAPADQPDADQDVAEAAPQAEQQPDAVPPSQEPADGQDIWSRLESMDAPAGQSGQAADDEEGEGTGKGTAEESGDAYGPYGPDGKVHSRRARGRSGSPTPQDDMDIDEIQVDVPWERLDKFGFFPGLTHTIKRAMFHAPSFFRAMPLKTGLTMSLIFYVLVSEFNYVVQYMWQEMGLTWGFGLTEPGLTDPGAASSMDPMNPLMGMLIFPVMSVAFLFFVVSVNHLFLLLFQSGRGGFEGTFKAAAYSSSTYVLALIPMVGPWLGLLWGMIVTIIAYRNVHRTTYPKVLLAFFMPFILFMLMAILVLQNMAPV